MTVSMRAHPERFGLGASGQQQIRLKKSLANTVSRRELLTGSIAGLAVVLIAAPANRFIHSGHQAKVNTLSSATGNAAMTAAITSASLALEHFDALLGENFGASGEGRQAQLVLSEVTVPPQGGATRPREIRSEGFSLLFELQDGSLAESGIVRIEHQRIGRHELFLHRVGLNAGAAPRYEAIFN